MSSFADYIRELVLLVTDPPMPRRRWYSREEYFMADAEETLHKYMPKTKNPRKRKFPTPYS